MGNNSAVPEGWTIICPIKACTSRWKYGNFTTHIDKHHAGLRGESNSYKAAYKKNWIIVRDEELSQKGESYLQDLDAAILPHCNIRKQLPDAPYPTKQEFKQAIKNVRSKVELKPVTSDRVENVSRRTRRAHTEHNDDSCMAEELDETVQSEGKQGDVGSNDDVSYVSESEPRSNRSEDEEASDNAMMSPSTSLTPLPLPARRHSKSSVEIIDAQIQRTTNLNHNGVCDGELYRRGSVSDAQLLKQGLGELDQIDVELRKTYKLIAQQEKYVEAHEEELARREDDIARRQIEISWMEAQNAKAREDIETRKRALKLNEEDFEHTLEQVDGILQIAKERGIEVADSAIQIAEEARRRRWERQRAATTQAVEVSGWIAVNSPSANRP